MELEQRKLQQDPKYSSQHRKLSTDQDHEANCDPLLLYCKKQFNLLSDFQMLSSAAAEPNAEEVKSPDAIAVASASATPASDHSSVLSPSNPDSRQNIILSIDSAFSPTQNSPIESAVQDSSFSAQLSSSISPDLSQFRADDSMSVIGAAEATPTDSNQD